MSNAWPCHFERSEKSWSENQDFSVTSPHFVRRRSFEMTGGSQPLTSFETRSFEMTKVDLCWLSGAFRKRPHARLCGHHSETNFENPYSRSHNLSRDCFASLAMTRGDLLSLRRAARRRGNLSVFIYRAFCKTI